MSAVALRSSDMARAAAFYSRLGLEFALHRHGKCPEYFAAELGGSVFELYPHAADAPGTLGTRVGFSVTSLDEVMAMLDEGSVISAPKDSEWGRRCGGI